MLILMFNLSLILRNAWQDYDVFATDLKNVDELSVVNTLWIVTEIMLQETIRKCFCTAEINLMII